MIADALSNEVERARSALSHLSPDCDRETWIKYGMCLKAEFGEAGFDVWDEWSSLSDKYRASDAKSSWRSIKADGKRTIATLFFDAKRAGWKDDTNHKKPTKAEIEARRLTAEARQNQAAEEDVARYAAAAKRGLALWEAAKPCTEHPYLTRKGVASHGLRMGRWERFDADTGEVVVLAENALLIPIQDRQRNLWSLQAIFAKDGEKKLYLKESAKAGNFFPIGARPQQRDGRNVFVLAEGYATGASVHAATGHTVLVCFDVGNLITVARALRERSADAWIVFAADNDTETAGNPGVTKATAAAEEVGGLVAVPPPGDFNDLHLAGGLEAVGGVIEAALARVPARAAGRILPVWLVPLTDWADLRRASFAADVVTMLKEDQELDPRGVMLRPYRDLNGLRAALEEVVHLLPHARLRVLIERELPDEAARIAQAAGASVEVLHAGASWVDDLWSEMTALTGMQKPYEDPADEDAAARELAGGAQAVAAPQADAGAGAVLAANRQAVALVEDEMSDASAAGHFAVLGFGGDKYYIFHHKKRQVLERSRHDFTDVGLVELAPRQWWESNDFGTKGSKGGIDKAAAAEWIFGVAHARGFFDVENRMRGRGAWNDKGRSVFHHGDHLTVDGVSMDLVQIDRTRYIYENKAPLHRVGTPATSQEGKKLFATAQMMRWVNPASAMFLCGWVFLAPIGGALKWRPHIWITGESGSGKSAVLRDFAGRLLGPTKLSLDAGDSSAAGIRQKLKRDALPVVLDEAEAQDDKGRERMRGILTLARGASTDGDTLIAKGTVAGRALEFSVRSMFCLGAIGAIAQEQQSDNSRFATLSVRNKSDNSVPDQWSRLKPALDEIERDEDLSARLLSRAILMLPTLHKCITVFSAAASRRLGSERFGDQYGTLLAGYWCLTHDVVVTESEAQHVIENIQWDGYSAGQRQVTPDAAKCLDSILDHIIVEKGSSVSIRALVTIAAGVVLEGYEIKEKAAARRMLQDRGITITENKGIRCLGIIRDSRGVADMLKGTSFASDWQTQLTRVEGYRPLHATSYGSTGQDRGHGFPLSSIRLHGGEQPI